MATLGVAAPNSGPEVRWALQAGRAAGTRGPQAVVWTPKPGAVLSSVTPSTEQRWGVCQPEQLLACPRDLGRLAE